MDSDAQFKARLGSCREFVFVSLSTNVCVGLVVSSCSPPAVCLQVSFLCEDLTASLCTCELTDLQLLLPKRHKPFSLDPSQVSSL